MQRYRDGSCEMLLLSPMLSVHQISLSFGGEELFKDISFQLNPGQRLGLVGRNGAGKSTLLKLIAGELRQDSGSINTPTGFKIGFLTQDLKINADLTVWDACATAFGDIKRLEADMAEMTDAMGSRTDYESQAYLDLIDRFHKAQEQFQQIGGYTFQVDMERVLKGLGFTQEDFHKPLNTFSGGWQMRVELAKILLQQNDLLLLDEPTNHLDIESIMWLENFLAESAQAVILVSHDRTFLNNATDRTLEIVLGRSYDFPAPYFRYLTLREEIREKQRQAAINQQREIKHTEQLIEKFRYKANKAAFAQSLIKKLDKMERLEVDVEDHRAMTIKFPPAPHSGKVVLKLEGIHKHYGPKHVLRGLDMELVRGDKVAFVGQNGQGKSTLVKIIADHLAHEGNVTIGHQVQMAYYAQDQADALDGSLTVLQTIENASPEDVRSQARKILGNFMFSGEDVDKKVKVLSGGERGRLAMCKLMLRPMNVLIMDEPTNHLDMVAKDVLKAALNTYDGTLILVSHDREFLTGLANTTYEFKEGKVKHHLGGIEYFLEQRQLEDMRALETQQKAKEASPKTKAASHHKEQRAKIKDLEKQIKQAERAMNRTQETYEALQTELDAMDAVLADPEQFKEASADPDYYTRYEALQQKVESAFNAWEEASESFNARQADLERATA